MLCYLLIIAAASVSGTVSGRDVALLPRLLLVFPTLHLVYGAGVLCGLMKPRYRGGARTHWDVEVRRVKACGSGSTFNVQR